MKPRPPVLAALLLIGAATTGLLAASGEGDGRAGPTAGREASEAIDALMRRGEEQLRLGRVEDALATYREALRLDPAHYGIQVLIADTLRRAGRTDEAMAGFEAALGLGPGRHEARVGMARIHRAAFRFEEGERVLQEALDSVHPARAGEVLAELAEVRRLAGRLDEAAAICGRALLADPDAARPRSTLALIEEERGALGPALEHWDRYLERRPDDEAARLRHEELKELRASIAALREAAAGSEDAEIRAELGRLLAISGDHAGAAEAYRASLEIEPDGADARRGLALALRRAGEDSAAAREYRRLLRFRPGDASARYALVAIAREASDRGREEAAWERLLRARPDDLYAARAWVEFLARTDAPDLERAAREAADDVAAASATPASLRRDALVLAEAGLWDPAARAVERALHADPTDPWTIDVANDLMFLRPELLQDLIRMSAARLPNPPSLRGADARLLALFSRLTLWSGRSAEAAKLARRAVEADPASSLARSALAEAAQRIERDPERTIREWRRAVDLDPSRPAAHVDLSLALLRFARATDAEKAARAGLELFTDQAPLLGVLGASLMEQGRMEEAAAAFASSLRLDPADNLGLARGQHPLALAALGRNLEARRALRGTLMPAPAVIYREAWAFARDAYRDRRFNGEDWVGWRDRYRGSLHDLEDAYRAVAEMLASLGDPHTRLRHLDETAAVYLARHGPRVTIDAMGRARPVSRTVTALDLDGGLGYIRLSNLADPAAAEEVRRALLRMREKEGLILDLRGNRGGLSRTADAIGDLLIGPGADAGVDVGPDGPEPQVTGGEGALIDGSIVVLVDEQTASAAERLARALQMSGRGVLSGDPTFGKGSAQMSRVLPGGGTVLVTMAEMLGPDGRPIQGHGLEPRGKKRKPRDGERPAPDGER